MKTMRIQQFRFRVLSCVSWFLIAFITSCYADSSSNGPVREPAVAGAFYPASADSLGKMIDSMLADAKPPAIEGRIRVLVVPHAGYVYSGPVAAYAFKAVAGQKYGTVILVGNSHHAGFDGAAIYPKGAFLTPLGKVEIDEALAAKIMAADSRIVEREDVHEPEHCLEVEIPFLQKTIGSFKLVPILLGSETMENSKRVADAIAKNVSGDVLVVASSDMSHYPKYEDAQFADGKTVEAICSGSAENLDRTLRQMERMNIPQEATCLCGEGAVKTALLVAEAEGAKKIQLLKYANSGDTAGTKDRVVGYCAVAFSGGEGGAMPKKDNEVESKGDEVLGAAEQEELLKLARLTVETVVKTGKKPEYKNTLPALEQPLGAFVTLRESGDLRGCIGRFQPDIPLYEVVIEMATAAATQDYRFSPVSPKELDKIDYEISVLSPLRKVASWKEIQLGKHGVEVVRGFRSGVFLPQVATETGWDLDTFMSNLCAHKAGLDPDAWKDPKTDIYVFTAQVFEEKK